MRSYCYYDCHIFIHCRTRAVPIHRQYFSVQVRQTLTLVISRDFTYINEQKSMCLYRINKKHRVSTSSDILDTIIIFLDCENELENNEYI
jgi:hypothetical protein